MVSEPVKPYFKRFLRVLTFCLEVSNGVVFCGNGVVNGVVKWLKEMNKNIRCEKLGDLIKLNRVKSF